jgi:hypothetical protein
MADIIDDIESFTITLTPKPAKGEIVNLNYPSSVEQGATFDVDASTKQGATFDVDASTKNVGTGSGLFKMQLFINGTWAATSSQFTLAAGSTSSDKIPAKIAPASGTSMSIEVKCIRVA